MEERDKTVGEAIPHNLTGVGVASLGGVLGTVVLGVTSAPAIVVAGVRFLAGTIVYTIFNSLYDSKVFGIQDGFDRVGQKIDAALDNKLGDFVKDVGSAISGTLDRIRSAFSRG